MRLELKEQLGDIEKRKVDIDRFEAVTSRKMEKSAIQELKKDINTLKNEFDITLTEIGCKVDLIRRDQDRILTLDDMLNELHSYVKLADFNKLSSTHVQLKDQFQLLQRVES